jgi:hypothetical protein
MVAPYVLSDAFVGNEYLLALYNNNINNIAFCPKQVVSELNVCVILKLFASATLL